MMHAPHDRSRRCALATLGSLATGSARLALPALALAPVAAARAEDAPLWPQLQRNLFDARTVHDAGDALIIEAPQRAADGSVVPVSAWSRPGAPAIRRLHLVIDENPTPLAGVFDFAPGHGTVGIETRVRVETYTHVRAIAETADGRLLMAQTYVKASGGCSTPANKDFVIAEADIGRMRLRVPEQVAPGESVVAQLMVQHPNSSGLVMDQLARTFAPAHYVHRVEVDFGGQPVWRGDINFSISQNPHFRFRFTPRAHGVLRARVADVRGSLWESTLPIELGA